MCFKLPTLKQVLKIVVLSFDARRNTPLHIFKNWGNSFAFFFNSDLNHQLCGQVP
jgi:hypothetical protein